MMAWCFDDDRQSESREESKECDLQAVNGLKAHEDVPFQWMVMERESE